MAERITDRISRLARLAAGRPPVLPSRARDRAPGSDPARPDPGSGGPRPLRSSRRLHGGTTSFRSHVTARGALAGMFLVCLVACLLAVWQGHDVLAALGYCLAAVLAPVYGRREAQLTVVLSAPAVFLLAELVTQALTAQGSDAHSSVFSVLEGTVLTLAGVAPWLFAGTIACVVIAMTRGLPDCVRQLREEQGGLSAFRSTGVARSPGAPAEPPVRRQLRS